MAEWGAGGVKKRERQLLEHFRRLPTAQADLLLEFAEFLAGRHGRRAAVPATPLDIPRPAEESVIAAVRRLGKTYPMLDKDRMLNATSGLVAQHLMQGRDAREVIDELEALFAEQYRQQCQEDIVDA